MLLGAGSAWLGLCPPLLSLLPLDLASVPHYSTFSPPLPAPAQLSDPRPGRTLIKSGCCCCCWQSKRKNFRTNSLALFLSWLMMMLARSPAQPLASCSSALYHFSWQSGAKSRQVATRHAAHRIASHETLFKPMGCGFIAHNLSAAFFMFLSFSVSAVTQDTNGRRQQAEEEEDGAEAIRSYRQPGRQ